MVSHDLALKRFVAIITALPISLAVAATLFVNPILRGWVAIYAPFLQAINLFYFIYFLIAGLIAILFEVPFTRPEAYSKFSGKFGTIIVASFGAMCLITAGLIFVGWYNITTDTGYYNTFLGFVLMPASIVMFGVEIISILYKNKRYAFHGGLS